MPSASASHTCARRGRQGDRAAAARRPRAVQRSARRAPVFPRCERLALAIERRSRSSRVGRRSSTARSPTALGDHDARRARRRRTCRPSSRASSPRRASTRRVRHASATLVAIDRGATLAYLHADGPPCVTPFVDRTELLRDLTPRTRKLVVAGLIVARRPRADHAAPRRSGAAAAVGVSRRQGRARRGAGRGAGARAARGDRRRRSRSGAIWDVLFHAYPGVRPRDARVRAAGSSTASRARSRSPTSLGAARASCRRGTSCRPTDRSCERLVDEGLPAN